MNYRHPRAQRLKVVLDLTEREEQDALQRWGDVQKKLAGEQEKRQQLKNYASDYQRQLSAPGKALIRAGDMHNTLGFIRQIESALRQQEAQIAQLEVMTAKARGAYLQAHGKTEALKNMMQRLEDEHALEVSRREQREADEWATRQSSQRNR